MKSRNTNELASETNATPNNQKPDEIAAREQGSLPPDEDPLEAKSGESETAVDESIREAFEKWESAEFAPRDRKIPIAADSLEASIGYSSLFRQMHQAYVRRIAYHRSELGGALSLEEARKRAFHPCKDRDEALKELDSLLKLPVETLHFVDLLELHQNAPRVAERLWEHVKREAGKEFVSGHLAANISFPVGYQKQVWNIARFIGVRESFIAEWKPKGGIEMSLIDMLTQCFFQWQYWLEQSVTRTETEPRMEHPAYREWKRDQEELKHAKSWATGFWFPPYVEEQDAMDHAIVTADRWNRMYMRTLRQLRELRRHSPLTISSAGQVNIAAEGGKQVNVAAPTKRGRTKGTE